MDERDEHFVACMAISHWGSLLDISLDGLIRRYRTDMRRASQEMPSSPRALLQELREFAADDKELPGHLDKLLRSYFG